MMNVVYLILKVIAKRSIFVVKFLIGITPKKFFLGINKIPLATNEKQIKGRRAKNSKYEEKQSQVDSFN